MGYDFHLGARVARRAASVIIWGLMKLSQQALSKYVDKELDIY